MTAGSQWTGFAGVANAAGFSSPICLHYQNYGGSEGEKIFVCGSDSIIRSFSLSTGIGQNEAGYWSTNKVIRQVLGSGDGQANHLPTGMYSEVVKAGDYLWAFSNTNTIDRLQLDGTGATVVAGVKGHATNKNGSGTAGEFVSATSATVVGKWIYFRRLVFPRRTTLSYRSYALEHVAGQSFISGLQRSRNSCQL